MVWTKFGSFRSGVPCNVFMLDCQSDCCCAVTVPVKTRKGQAFVVCDTSETSNEADKGGLSD